MKTILVVEDFLHARNLICEKLERKGYHTLGAASVQEAYQVLAHNGSEVNLVLSDIEMEDAAGFDLLKQVKNSPRLKDLPFVFWTTEHDKRRQKSPGKNFFKEINRAINTKGCMINLA